MKLIIISDLHFDENNDWNKINTITEHLSARIKMKLNDNENTAFIILGDIVNCGGDGNNAVKFAEASKFFDMIKTEIADAQFYFIPGNHEIKNNDIVEEFHTFAKQYNPTYESFTVAKSVFSYDLAGINLILADSTLGCNREVDGKIDVEMLKKEFSPKCRNLIFMHYPPYNQEGVGRYIENSEELIATHADFIFYGHQHGYVKILDFIQNDTAIHSVGATFKTSDGAKSQFILIDVIDGRINYARRYDYVSEYYHSQLLFPKKENMQSQYLKLDTPKKTNDFVSKKYRTISNEASDSFIRSLFEKLGGIDEAELLKKKNHILLIGSAGMGKTYSLINMYNSMSENQDYYPIWLSLGRANYETIKAHLNYAQFNTIDNKTPMLFLDGLDEMKSEYIDGFMRDVVSAINGDYEVKIVVSMRANYQLSIDKFAKYELMPLTQKDIEEVAANNDIENVEDFINQIDINNCLSLSQNPFYLFEMIKIYKQNNSLPKQADLFKHMIQIRLREGDERHKCDYDNSLMGNEYLLKEKLRKLSFFMSAVHEYSLENAKYTQILEPKIRGQFQKTGLIAKAEKSPEIFWQFEHRSFSEFLTAEFISNLSFEELLDIITYDDELKKLRPSWGNIVGFILSLRDNKDLAHWLVENAVDELCELQPDSLTVDDRDEVFLALFQDCSEKNVPIYTKFLGDKLAKYFQSDYVINYLIECVEKNASNSEVASAFDFLEYCTNFYGKEDLLLNIIKDKYLSSEVAEHIVMSAIDVIITISAMYEVESIAEIISIAMKYDCADIIGATCDLISKTHTSDEHAEYLLDKLKNPQKVHKNFSAEQNLIEAVCAFSNTDNILSAIRALIDHKGYTRLYLENELFSKLLESLCSNQVIDSVHLDEELAYFFVTCSRRPLRFEINALKECFKHLKVESAVLKLIISSDLMDWDMLLAIEEIMDDSLLPTLIDCYNNNELNSETIKWYARRLPEDSTVYLAIIEAVKVKEGVAIERAPIIDCGKQQLEGLQKCFDSFFNKGDFAALVIELGEYFETDILCGDLLNDSYDKLPNDRTDFNYIVTAVLHSGMGQTKLSDFISEVDWNAFSMHHIIHILKGKTNINVSDEQKGVLAEYYSEMIANTDFEVSPLDENTLDIAEKVVFLIDRFSFSVSDEKLLQFLVLPWYVFGSSPSGTGSEALNYIEERIHDKRKLHEKIIYNLKQGNLNQRAIQTHINYCLKHKMAHAVEVATAILKGINIESLSLQNVAADYLVEIKSEGYVDDLVDENMSEHLLRHLSIKLTTENQKLVNVLIEKNTKSEDGLLYLEELLGLNSEYALSTYIKLAKERNGIPDKHIDSMRIPEVTHAIRNIQNINLLDYIGELFVLSLSYGFDDEDAFGLYTSASTAIQNVIQIDALRVRTKLKELIEQNPDNSKLQTSCNYYLNNIDKRLDVSNDKPWSVKKAIGFIEKVDEDCLAL